jgi:hypothetical protein
MPKPIYGRSATKTGANINVNDLVKPVKDVIDRLNIIMTQIHTMNDTPEGIDKNIIMQRIEILISDLRIITSA